MAKTVYILGAGASHAYDRSIYGVRPPLARDFFKAYHELPTTAPELDVGGFEVRVGAIVNFVRDHYDIPPHAFYMFDEDIEQFLVRLDDVIEDFKNKARKRGGLKGKDVGDLWEAQRARFDLLLLFSRVLIDTTDGQPCPYHGLLAANLAPGDVVIDFNWDTLVDRALYANDRWFPDTGYGIGFDAIMDGEWRVPNNGRASDWDLLKLHGSINWLISYPGLDPSTGLELSHLPLDRYHDKFCYVAIDGQPHFGCREVLMNPLVPPKRDDGYMSITANMIIDPDTIRYRPEIRTFGDYTPFAKLASLIIPPSHRKNYDLPGQVFEQLWPKALRSLIEADELFVCGYRLPETDERPRRLLQEAAAQRDRPLRIGLVTPHPESMQQNLSLLLGDAKAEIWHAADSFEKFVAPHTYGLVIPGPALE